MQVIQAFTKVASFQFRYLGNILNQRTLAQVFSTHGRGLWVTLNHLLLITFSCKGFNHGHYMRGVTHLTDAPFSRVILLCIQYHVPVQLGDIYLTKTFNPAWLVLSVFFQVFKSGPPAGNLHLLLPCCMICIIGH